MKTNAQKRFRTILNTMMLVCVWRTLPYIFVGESQYQHEIWGTMAFILILYHCVMNRWWYKRVSKSAQGRKKKLPTRNTYYLNMLLTLVAILLGISSIMISVFAFGFLQNPYYVIWHYIHLVSGGAFILLILLHALLHVPAINRPLKDFF